MTHESYKVPTLAEHLYERGRVLPDDKVLSVRIEKTIAPGLFHYRDEFYVIPAGVPRPEVTKGPVTIVI